MASLAARGPKVLLFVKAVELPLNALQQRVLVCHSILLVEIACRLGVDQRTHSESWGDYVRITLLHDSGRLVHDLHVDLADWLLTLDVATPVHLLRPKWVFWIPTAHNVDVRRLYGAGVQFAVGRSAPVSSIE